MCNTQSSSQTVITCATALVNIFSNLSNSNYSHQLMFDKKKEGIKRMINKIEKDEWKHRQYLPLG